MVPLRAAPVFAVTLNATVPLPVPLAPFVIEIHAESLAAVHAQVLADAETATVPVPPLAPTDWLARSSVNVHAGGGGGGGGGGGAAACETVKVFPAAVIVPDRTAPEFWATLNATAPPPLPEAPLVMEIQAAFDAAVHAQDEADAVTANEPEPPVSETFWSDGEIAYVHGVATAACDTVNVLPATVIVPLRALPEFAATLNDTLPLPVPELPPDREIHAAFDAAVHPHVLDDAVTATEPDPPASDIDWSAGAMENVQVAGGAAAWETLKVFPATEMVPLRAAPAFAATENDTLPLPDPELPFVTVIHDAFDAAVHAHVVVDAVTAIDPVPPPSETDWSDGAIDNVHGTGAAAA